MLEKVVAGWLASEKVPAPEITDQVPTPTVAALAYSVNVGGSVDGSWLHADWLVPATAVVGTWSTCTVIVVELLPQVLPIVHLKVLMFKFKLPTVAEGLNALLNVPVPPITDQVPTPVNGVDGAFPVNAVVGVEAQIV